MTRTLLACLAVGASVLVAPAAHAADGDTIHGGCNYATVENLVDRNEYDGVIGDFSVTKDGTGAPIGATVTCWIEVNAVEAPGTRFSYTGIGVQAGTNPISFVADAADWVQDCQAVTYADGSTETTNCPEPTDIHIPPECLGTCDIFYTLNQVFVRFVDPAVCPVLARLAGTYPGGVSIDPTGDVIAPDPLDLWVGPVYDCPPYVAPEGTAS